MEHQNWPKYRNRDWNGIDNFGLEEWKVTKSTMGSRWLACYGKEIIVWGGWRDSIGFLAKRERFFGCPSSYQLHHPSSHLSPFLSSYIFQTLKPHFSKPFIDIKNSYGGTSSAHYHDVLSVTGTPTIIHFLESFPIRAKVGTGPHRWNQKQVQIPSYRFRADPNLGPSPSFK